MKVTCPKCTTEYDISIDDQKHACWDDVPLECPCGATFSLVDFSFDSDCDEDYEDVEARAVEFNQNTSLKNAISEMQGIAAAVIHDNEIDNREIKLIGEWLVEHERFIDLWPINDLAVLMRDILKDGVVTNDERSRLLQFLKTFAVGPRLPKHVTGIFDENPKIVFEERSFLFTGKLAFGKRATAQRQVLERGGKIAKSVTWALDYLIIGELGSDAWAQSRFGRKIEKSIELRDQGAELKIIKESDFIKNLS